MGAHGKYRVRYAPLAEAQIDAALLWWAQNRPLAPGLLALELDATLGHIEEVPQAGRRVKLRGQPNARRVLLRKSGYHIYYVILEEEREVRIVYFRHARRRSPLAS